MPGELEPPTRRTATETETDSAPARTDDEAPFPYVASGVDPATRALPRPAARCVLEATVAASEEAAAVGSTACPDCGGDTANGAGLFTCLECAWTGVLR